MINIITAAEIDGYGSDDTNFDSALLNAPPESSSAFEAEIIAPIIEVLDSADQTAVLLVTGHGDRVDTVGLTREQRRQQELDVSFTRSANAKQSVQRIVAIRRGSPPEISENELFDLFREIKQLVFSTRGAGAAGLVQAGDPLTEEQRRQNRRVAFTLIRFLPT